MAERETVFVFCPAGSVKQGADCCGDRYACDADEPCLCGCERFYCSSCLGSHHADLVRRGAPTRGNPRIRHHNLPLPKAEVPGG